MVNSSPSRSGRRPGTPATRDDILAAAQAAFVDAGYAGTTIRGVAREAGVDPALVLHFFGTKEGLFVEAMRPLFNRTDAVRGLLAADPDTAGERLMAFFLATWDAAPDRRLLLGIIRSAVSAEIAAQIARDEVLGGIQSALEDLGIDRPAFRAGMIAGQLMGLAFARYVVRAPAVADATHAELTRAVGPSLQRYITHNLSEGGAE